MQSNQIRDIIEKAHSQIISHLEMSILTHKDDVAYMILGQTVTIEVSDESIIISIKKES